MDNDKLEVGALLQRTWATAAAVPAASIGFIVAMSALGIVADTYAYESSGVMLLVNIANFVAAFFLMMAILTELGLRRDGEGGGFGVYFGVSLLGGLGMVLGFVLLIVPGIVLMVRWSAALAIGLCEDDSSSNSLGESWRMTEGHFWPIFVVVLIGLVPLVLGVVGLSAGLAFTSPDYAEGAPSLMENIVLNVLLSAYSVYSTALGIAVYWMLRGARREVADVFA